MTRIASAASLLHAAVLDLHSGKAALAERLSPLGTQVADPKFGTLLRDEAARAGNQAARLRGCGVDMTGPKNLWIAGILDDADRDARSTGRGRLLDIALVGAVRKAIAAHIVSSDTAIALARAEGDAALLAALEANRAEEVATDLQLRERLDAIVG